jgi:hypothetical protein
MTSGIIAYGRNLAYNSLAMQEKTLQALSKLSALLKEDPRVLRLEKAEKEATLSEEVRSLSTSMQEKADAYVDARSHYGEEGALTLAAQKELYLAKKALDSNPLAWEYSQAYAVIRRLYADIDSVIYGPYREKRKCLEK